jgi:hypothetical protein
MQDEGHPRCDSTCRAKTFVLRKSEHKIVDNFHNPLRNLKRDFRPLRIKIEAGH